MERAEIEVKIRLEGCTCPETDDMYELCDVCGGAARAAYAQLMAEHPLRLSYADLHRYTNALLEDAGFRLVPGEARWMAPDTPEARGWLELIAGVIARKQAEYAQKDPAAGHARGQD